MEIDMSLTVEIKNRRDVELQDLAKGMLALHTEYKRYISEHNPDFASDEVRLYVKQISHGSIITELAAYSPLVLPLFEQFETAKKYAEHITTIMQWLLGKEDQPERQVSRQTLQNIHDIMEPIAKDSGSTINLAVNGNGNTINIFSASSVDANAIQNSARRQIDQFREPSEAFHSQVLMYWHRASASEANARTDRVVIQSISKDPVAVIFDSVDLKKATLFEPDKPFAKAFLVDVEIQYVMDVPRLYKVVAVHKTIDLN